jgi:hypothetical protein
MSRNKLYIGKAGQYIAMSEFLMRGWNVAIPEVDVGDDIFVVKDETGEFVRIQVKTGSAIEKPRSFGVQYKLSYTQLEQTFFPDLIYFFVIRFTQGSNKFILIKRSELLAKVQIDNVGSRFKDTVQLYLSLQKVDDKVTCSSVDFTNYVNNFQSFPIIDHSIAKISGN